MEIKNNALLKFAEAGNPETGYDVSKFEEYANAQEALQYRPTRIIGVMENVLDPSTKGQELDFSGTGGKNNQDFFNFDKNGKIQPEKE